MNKLSLFLKWIVLNLAGAAMFFVFYINGWIGVALQADITPITPIIMFLFLIGLCMSGIIAWDTNKKISNIIASTGKKKTITANKKSALEAKLFVGLIYIKTIASTLVLLGLIGTVIGFIVSLSGVTPDSVGSIVAMTGMVSTLIQGLGIALYTTLAGALTYLWLNLNHSLLRKGMIVLYIKLIG